MLVLEAVVDNNLWFWHAAFGFVGSCNDINILDVSPLHTHFLDGSHAAIDFVNTILIPLTKKEKQFTGWQEAARKDVKRAFGVLQSKWCLLASPIEKWDEVKIQHMVIACLIMHNMMVEEILDHGDCISSDYFDDGNNNVMDEKMAMYWMSQKSSFI